MNGASRLALKATFVDPTMLRELGTIDLLEQVDLPHSVTNPIRLELNGEYIGVYLDVERLNEDFLNRMGWDPNGRFYRVYGDMQTQGTLENYIKTFESAGSNDWERSDIIAFSEAVNNLPDEDILPYLEANLDIEGFLEMYCHYIWTSNDDWLNDDYYLYRGAPKFKWTWIPWDVHESWELNNVNMPINFGTSESKDILFRWNRPCEQGFKSTFFTPPVHRKTQKLHGKSFIHKCST